MSGIRNNNPQLNKFLLGSRRFVKRTASDEVIDKKVDKIKEEVAAKPEIRVAADSNTVAWMDLDQKMQLAANGIQITRKIGTNQAEVQAANSQSVGGANSDADGGKSEQTDTTDVAGTRKVVAGPQTETEKLSITKIMYMRRIIKEKEI